VSAADCELLRPAFVNNDGVGPHAGREYAARDASIDRRGHLMRRTVALLTAALFAVLAPTAVAAPDVDDWLRAAEEGQSFQVSPLARGATADVRYGAGATFIGKTVPTMQWSPEDQRSGLPPSPTWVHCDNGYFVGWDPVPGVRKHCDIWLGPTPVFTECAVEGGRCEFDGTKTVRYGGAGRWVERTVTSGAPCRTDFFGLDPAPGVVKTLLDREPLTAAEARCGSAAESSGPAVTSRPRRSATRDLLRERWFASTHGTG
jgi:hypothetical protein